MNIAAFTNSYKPFIGGVETSISLFKKELEGRGHKVYIFAPRYPGYSEDDPSIIRVSSVEAPTYPGFYLPISFVQLIQDKFAKLNIDLVHVHQPFLLGEIGLRIAHKNGLPLVFTYHTLYEKYLHYVPFNKEITRTFLEKLVSSFCSHCDLVICPSWYVYEKVSQKLPGCNLRMIPTGLDLESRKDVEKGDIRKRYDIPRNAKIMLYAGRITKEKNLDFLISCAISIIRKRDDTYCFFIGDGDQRARLEKLAADEGLAGKIIFPGEKTRDELYRFYNDADIFIFSSKSETQGLVILEAMSFSLPVVAVDAPAISEQVKNGINGYIVKEKEISFVEKALLIIEDKQGYSRMAGGALQTAQQNSIRHTADLLLDEYTSLLEKENSRNIEPFRRTRILWNTDWKPLLREMLRRKT